MLAGAAGAPGAGQPGSPAAGSSSGNDTAVRLWDLYRDKPLQTLPHPAPVFSVIWSPDGQRLATGCLDGCIRLWEMQAEKLAVCVATLSGHSNLVRELAFAPHGRRLASAGSDRLVIVW